MNEPGRENPFPGMNPYLEDHWSDVHTRLITYMSEALAEKLPPDLISRAEEHISIEDEVKASQYRADVAVIEHEEAWRAGQSSQWTPADGEGSGVQTEPEIIVVDGETERWLEVRDIAGRLITVIEVLSPSNKRGFAPRYQAKCQAYLELGINLVEIDLLRIGHHVLALPASALRMTSGVRYVVCVSRAARPGQREVYHCPLREALPSIRIPLRDTDADVRLALQPLINRCYVTGRYGCMDYRKEPQPPLPPEEMAWLDERLRSAGLR